MKRKSPTIGPSLLLVDDDLHLLDSMGQWLSEQEFLVTTAHNCATATKALQDGHFDLALIDLRLGSEDGFTLLLHCRKNHPKTTVMLMTAALPMWSLPFDITVLSERMLSKAAPSPFV